jgi:oleate hydratase
MPSVRASSSRREAIPGYGLLIEDDGDYVKKKMSQSTGEEILTELICQLGFDDILCEVPTTTDVTTVMMPYASSLFSRRIPADRPQGAPRPSREFAFLGQFTDLPEDVVFAVEYSVHGPCTPSTACSAWTGKYADPPRAPRPKGRP